MLLKQVDTVLETCILMEASASRWIPRSRTEDAGWIKSEHTQTGARGIWCWRLLDAHQMTSVLLAFSWSRLQRIQEATSSTHPDARSWSWDAADGWQEPYICVSLAHKCGRSWYLSTSRSKSAIYSTNRIGLRTDPYHTRMVTDFKPLLVRRSMLFKVTDFGTNRKLIYDFLLAINTNLPLLSRTVSRI